MESNIPPSPSQAKLSNPSTPNTSSSLHRQSAQVFDEASFSSPNPFDADTWEVVDRGTPTGGIEIGQASQEAMEDNHEHSQDDKNKKVHGEVDEENQEHVGAFEEQSGYSDKNSVDGQQVDKTLPTGATTIAVSLSLAPRMSTLRRKAEELFGGKGVWSDMFDADEEEFMGGSALERKMEEDELEQTSPSRAVRPSTLRRKTDELFSSKGFSSNPFDADEDEFEDVGPVGQTSVGNRTEVSAEAVKSGEHIVEQFFPIRTMRPSTLRRKTDELFSGSGFLSSPFDPDEGEFDEASTVMQPSTLRRKTNEVFTGKEFSSNPFDPDEDEFEDSTSNHAVRPSTLKRKTDELFSGSAYSSSPFDPDDEELLKSPPIPPPQDSSSYSLRIPPVRPAGPITSISRVPTTRVEGPPQKHDMAVKLLSKHHIEAQKDIPTKPSRLSTVKRKSYGILAQHQGHSPTNVWDADDEEFAQKLEIMRLNPTQRIRGNSLKSLRGSASSPKGSSLLHRIAEDKENITRSQQNSPYGRVQRGSPASTGNSTRIAATPIA